MRKYTPIKKRKRYLALRNAMRVFGVFGGLELLR